MSGRGTRLLIEIQALIDKYEQRGITCDCGHTLGEHNGLGCYGVVEYSPKRVTCACPLTDDRHDGELAAADLRAILAGL